jgi:hypothetical protein
MRVEPETLTLLLRLLGMALVVVGPLHGVFWYVFDWGNDSRKLMPLNGRVFVAHLASVVFVVTATGLLLLLRPELLVARSELARLLLWALVIFFGLRLLAQPLYFNPLLAVRRRRRWAVRLAATLGWLGCWLVLALALSHQLASVGG